MIFAECLFGAKASGEILFHSDFECGETFLAAELNPGASEIELIANHRLEEWPADGGPGIVQGNLPSASDTFRYGFRVGPILKQVTGLQKSHPRHADIRTGNLVEWTQSGRVRSTSPNWIRVTSSRSISGNYSARFSSSGPVHFLSVPLPTDRKVYFARFSIRFAKEILDRNQIHLPLCAMTIGKNPIQRLELSKAGLRKSASLRLRTRGDQTDIRQRKRIPASPIVPDRVYHVEYQVHFSDTNEATVSLSVDGLELRKQQAIYRWQTDLFPVGEFTLGRFMANATEGTFFVDDVWVADTILHFPPTPPAISFQNSRLTGTAFECLTQTEKHKASHWQIADANSWLQPLYSSGRDTADLTVKDFPFAFLLSGAITSQIRISSAIRVPTYLQPERDYYARCRYQNQHNKWSVWSIPIKLRAPQPNPSQKALTANLPVVDAIYLSEIGSATPLEEITKDTWYDLHLSVKDKKGWENLLLVDVFLSGDAGKGLVNYHDRGGAYDPQTNYGISLSLGDNSRYYKTPDGWASTIEMAVFRHPPYIDDSQGRYAYSTSESRAQIRMKLPGKALTGPWLISGYAANRQHMFSPIFTSMVLVADSVDSGPHTGPDTGLYVTVLGIAVFGAFMYWLGKRQARTRESVAGATESIPQPSPKDPNLGRRIQKAIAFMKENYARDISAGDVAQSVNLSPKYFGRTFAAETGTTISNYLNEIRIEESKKLLTETDLNVTEIAYKVGFNSADHFSHVFRSIEDMSPREHRGQG